MYEYTLYEVPQPHTENQHTAKVDTVNTHTENRRQISKEELSKDELNIDEVSKDKEKEKMNDILISLGNTELIEMYWDYIEMRKEINAPLNARSLKILIARNERLSKNNVKIQKLLLENATLNEWKNIYLPNESELNTINKEIADEFKNWIGLE